MPLIIEGKRRLGGEVRICGAKNAALPIIAATLLTDDECLLENVPYIEDTRTMVKVLQHLGVAARFEGANLRASTEPLCPTIWPRRCGRVS
jgi:UDP-N-acetylglucosamine 1-carboxyvinyltransferase